MKFSERLGFVNMKDIVQLDTMSEDLRNDIFNLCEIILNNPSPISVEPYKKLWTSFFHERLIYFYEPTTYKLFDKLKFYEVYDYLEFVIENFVSQDSKTRIMQQANLILQNGHSGYRFINNILSPISSKTDIKNVENAIKIQIDGGNLQKALTELSNKENINYKVVIQKSIDAVEYTAKYVSVKLFNGKDSDTLGQSIKKLGENNFIDDHHAYLRALGALYGFTSDGGIRHPKDRNYQPDLGDATFMLEICSAFVSMLKTKLSELENK